jgi:hypothetical protein
MKAAGKKMAAAGTEIRSTQRQPVDRRGRDANAAVAVGFGQSGREGALDLGRL